MPKDKIEEVVQKSIRFIVRNQNNDGSFNSFSKTEDKKGTEVFITTFYSSIILYSLAGINDSKILEVKNKVCRFLAAEKSKSGTFNYWAKSFIKYKTESCPDDLDDTACALASLFSCDRKLVKQSDLASFTKTLIGLEAKVGGPYYTWVLPADADKKWRDVDLAVNANIGLFLSLLKIKLPKVEGLVEKAIRNKKFFSTYYPEASTIYFISRFYKGKCKNELLEQILKQNRKKFSDPLQCALFGISILNLDGPFSAIKKNVKYLAKNQRKNGGFESGVFISERTFSDGKKRYSGSETLITALALELLDRYKKQSAAKEAKIDSFGEIREKIIKRAKDKIRLRFGRKLEKEFDTMLDKIIKGDLKDQVLLQPFLFQKSLKINRKLEKDFLIDLALASAFGWISYTIFDNVSDEGKDLDKLSLAIVLNRELEGLFCRQNPSFFPVYQKFMDRVDYANFYEQNFALFDPNKITYKKIYPQPDFVAEKSIAHSLAGLAIFYKCGFREESLPFQKLCSFYKNYLTARQLNDDAHDWEEDLKNGRINYAGQLLLKDYGEGKKIILERDKLKLQKVFWDKTILYVSRLIKNKIKKTREDLHSLSGILDQDYLSSKLEELNNSAQMALEERSKTKEFINSL